LYFAGIQDLLRRWGYGQFIATHRAPGMTEPKTKQYKASVAAFISAIEDVDGKVLEKLINESVKIMRKKYETT